MNSMSAKQMVRIIYSRIPPTIFKLEAKTNPVLKMTTIGSVLVIGWALLLRSFPGAETAETGERFKRELRFPKGGSFSAAVALASFLPKGPTEGLAHVLEFNLGFPFPEKFVFGKKKTQKKTWQSPHKISWHQPVKRRRKERNAIEAEKASLLLKVEDAITRIGFNGSACVLKFQCELRNVSPENSFLEELLFGVFKTSFEPRECKMHDQTCPVSFLQIIMHSEQISAPPMM